MRLATLALVLMGCASGASSPASSLPAEKARWVVIAPHPDDEALMAAGLLARTPGAHVVIMTNGDYDCIVDGAVRQSESLEGLAAVGVSRERIHFLGYPDGYLPKLGARPLIVRRSFDGKCAEAESGTRAGAVADLAGWLGRLAPTDVVVTHPEDTHPDHATTYALFREAAEAAHVTPRVHRAMVHNGDCWPMGPKATEPCPDTPVDSAEKMPELTGRLAGYVAPERLAVPDPDRRAKIRAIAAYDSQTRHGAADSYLFSYARGDEMFFLQTLPLAAPRRMVTAHVAPGGTLALGSYRVRFVQDAAELYIDERRWRSWPLPHDLWGGGAPREFRLLLRDAGGVSEIELTATSVGVVGVAVDVAQR